jgi:hypothetical protein
MYEKRGSVWKVGWNFLVNLGNVELVQLVGNKENCCWQFCQTLLVENWRTQWLFLFKLHTLHSQLHDTDKHVRIFRKIFHDMQIN